MFPLRDNQPTYKLPLITYVIIAINVMVLIIEMTVVDPDSFIYTFALVPELVDFSKLASLYPFITSQFLHAGIFHILSNMWFLKIFGDNVEEKFGHMLYLVIYLVAGIVGGLAQYIFSPNSDIPMLGASGAVAGVLGAYLVFFPNHRIETIIPFGVFTRIVQVPAFIMLVYWFVTQIFSGIGSIAYAQVGGVAWFAHIGGFVTGWIVAKFFSGEIIEVVEKEEVLD